MLIQDFRCRDFRGTEQKADNSQKTEAANPDSQFLTLFTNQKADFTIDFLKKVRPFATVISSGDNESYAHPQADALGCAGRYTRGSSPKVYDTELARSINASNDILFGMINLRSDGKRIYMAQMKERRSGADIWDSYTIK